MTCVMAASIKVVNRIIFGLIIMAFLKCSSLKNYLINRGNDLQDIIILGVEKDVYGINIIATVPVVGLSYNSNGIGIGLRNSHLGIYKMGDSANPVRFEDKRRGSKFELSMGNSYFHSTGFHFPINPRNLRVERKKYMVINIPPKVCNNDLVDVYYQNMKAKCSWVEGGSHLPVEISFAIYLGIRIGFNFGELIDFFGGLVGFDPMRDDYDQNGNLPEMKGWKEKYVTTIISIDEKDLPLPLPEKKDWESKLDTLDEKMDKRLTK